MLGTFRFVLGDTAAAAWRLNSGPLGGPTLIRKGEQCLKFQT